MPFDGVNLILSIKFLISSTPLFDAASISIISGFSVKFLQNSQFSHGDPSTGFMQLIAFANTLAVLVLPVPLGPEKI